MATPKRFGVMAAALALVCSAAMAVDFNSDCYPATNHEFFTSAFQRFVTSKRGGGAVGKTRYNPTAGLIGYRFSTPQWSAGMAVSYESGRSKNSVDGGDFKFRDETLGASLFARYNGFSNWYAQSSFFTGFNRTKMRGGTIDGERVTGDGRDNSMYYAATLEFGKTFEFAYGTRLTPHAGFNYAYVPGTTLRGRVGGEPFGKFPSQSFYEIPVGVTVATDFYASDWVITPSLDVTAISSLGNIDNDNYNFRSGFSAYDGSKWQVHGVGSGHWGGRVSAGINAIKSEKFDLGVNYAYEARKNYSDHRIMAGIGMKF